MLDINNFSLHGIRRCAYKTLDMEVLLEVAKEDFNVPACLVEVGDGSSREFHVVGEQYHREMVLSVIYCNPAYALGVLSGRAVSCLPHDFVYEHFLMDVIGQATFLYALINQIVLTLTMKNTFMLSQNFIRSVSK